MSKSFRLIFFVIGIVAVVFMLLSSGLSFVELADNLQRADYYIILAVLLWLVVYFINTISWKVILKGFNVDIIAFYKLYKFTLSGFALNYITPGGLNGGEPYRILELRNYTGTEIAISSTILYSIAHMASHILFWGIGAILMLFFYSSYIWPSILVFSLAIGAFILGMLLLKKGIANLLVKCASLIPFLGKYIRNLFARYETNIVKIDLQIANIYHLKSEVLIKTIALEFLGRLLSCIELLFIPQLFDCSYLDAYLIVAISSLMGNLLFFMPMQLGGREGGFVLAFSILGIPIHLGVFVALLFRIRELLLIFIGVIVIQLKSKRRA